MAQYTITFSCGHTEVRDLVGKEKDRQRKIEYFQEEGLCSDCYKLKKLQEKEDELSNFEKEKNLLPLEGSEKQIALAREIRFNHYKYINEYVQKSLIELSKEIQKEKIERKKELYKATFLKMIYEIKNNISAKFWIEEIKYKNYDSVFFEKMIKDALKQLFSEEKKEESKEESKEKSKEKSKEEVVIPEKNITSDIAKISFKNEYIFVSSPKNEDIRKILKEDHFDFDWDKKSWRLLIGKKIPSVEDKMAEIGNHLLQKGIPISAPNNVLKMAVDGLFKVTPERILVWIESREVIRAYFEKNDNLYKFLKNIYKSKYGFSKYYGSYFEFSAKNFEIVRDLQNLWSFEITSEVESIVFAEEKKFKEKEKKEIKTNSKKELNNGRIGSIDILDDLRDE